MAMVSSLAAFEVILELLLRVLGIIALLLFIRYMWKKR